MAAQVRTALMRLGLSQPAAQYATTTMGLETLNAWRDLQTDEDLISLSKNLRSPGGTQGAGANAPRHPGYAVSIVTIGNIKVMRLALKFAQRVQRTVTPADITMQWINEWEFLVEFYQQAKKKKPNDDDLPKIQMGDWAKTKEKIINHFSEVYNEEGTPLAYILRDDVAVQPEAADPQDNYDNDHVKELIARAAHAGPTYRADSRTMCRLLRKMCDDTAAYVHIIIYTANGRAAWTALMDQYLGPQHVQNQAAI